MAGIRSSYMHGATFLMVGLLASPSRAQTSAGTNGELNVSAGAASQEGSATGAADTDADANTGAPDSEPGALPGDDTATSNSEDAESGEAQASYDYAGKRAESGYRSPTYGGADEPYLTRYKPQGNEWEVTLFTGMLFPSKQHNLKVAVLPVDEYSKVAAQLGFRLGYFPLSFLGAEFQSFVGGGKLRDAGYSAVFYGLSGHLVAQLPLASIVPFATIGVGTLGASSEVMGHDRDTAFIWGMGVKAAVSKRVDLRFDFQDTLTQKRDAKNGKQTHSPAIQLGATFVFERDPVRTARIDSDYDGLFDEDDKCPTEGALTVDGCPRRVDSDEDGLFDDEDQCPMAAGPSPDGCPDLDLDKDGVPVPTDQCPEEPGVEPSGCPDLDPDKDGITAEKDECPEEPETKNGYKDNDGCPDEVPEEIKRFTGVIPGIQFKQGTAEISNSSLATLDEAARILSDFPDIRLEVSGHTSSEGTEERNQELSVQRAEAVRKYFIDHGIDEGRLVARGAGATEPVADNATKEGREQNRRIEFRVLPQEP